MFKSFINRGVVIILTLVVITLPLSSTANETDGQYNIYYINDKINMSSAIGLLNFLKEAKNLNPNINRILLIMDGDGGKGSVTNTLRELILSSPVPVDTLVAYKAISANANLFLLGKNRYNVNGTLHYHLARSGNGSFIPPEYDKDYKDKLQKSAGLSDEVIEYLFKPDRSFTIIDADESLKLGVSTSNQLPELTQYLRH
jgi:hypothetical protein